MPFFKSYNDEQAIRGCLTYPANAEILLRSGNYYTTMILSYILAPCGPTDDRSALILFNSSQESSMYPIHIHGQKEYTGEPESAFFAHHLHVVYFSVPVSVVFLFVYFFIFLNGLLTMEASNSFKFKAT